MKLVELCNLTMRPKSSSHSIRWVHAVRTIVLIGLLSSAEMSRADGPPTAPSVAVASKQGALGEPAIRRYLILAYGIAQHLKKECGGATPLKDLQLSYARLLGTSTVQVLVEATTCMMGNGGADIVLLLHVGPRHQIEPLILDDGSRPTEELYAGQLRTPRIEARDGRLVRWFVKANPSSQDGSLRREITYRWSGDRFVIDTVHDLPEPMR